MTSTGTKRRRWARLTAVAAAVMLLATGCGDDDSDEGAQPAETDERIVHPESVERLRLSGGDFGYPTPFAYVRGTGMILNSFIFDTLLWEDATGDPIPWLAAKWSHSDDGREWRFTIRDGVQWQDGRPLTAEDVKFSFDYVISGPGSTVSRLGSVIDLQEVVVEGNEVVVRLNQPTAVFEEDVGMRLFVIPKHIWSTVTDPAKFRGDGAVVGSGPYKLESVDQAAGTYLYTANDSFFLGTPYVKRLELVPAPDELLGLQRGDLDAAELLEEPAPAAQLRAFENNDKYTKLEGGYDFVMALHINLAKGFPWESREYRQAVAYAIDRKDMVDRVLQGRGAPGSMGGLPPDHPYLAPDLPTYDHDVAKAGSLLDGIGMKDTDGDGLRELPDGGKFTQEIQSNNRFSADAAELIKEYLREVGIDVRIQVLDPAAADQAAGQGHYTMALIGYGGLSGDPDQNLRSKYAANPKSTSFTRAIGYSNEELTQAANAQIETLDPAVRRPLIHRIQQIAAEDVPVILLYLPKRTSFYRADLFDNWYYTPGCSPCRGTRNKHMLVTGRKTGFSQ
jgi:peptide/nickel transport system substrate-binding protein